MMLYNARSRAGNLFGFSYIKESWVSRMYLDNVQKSVVPVKTCSVEGCDRKVIAKNLCGTHYSQVRKGQTPTMPIKSIAPKGKLMSFLLGIACKDPTDTCIRWPYGKNTYGYGMIQVGAKLKQATHVILAMSSRPVPKGFMACHTCRNRDCVNPNHLYIGSAKSNALDMVTDGTLLRGEDHPCAAINQKQALEIIQRYHAGGTSYKKLAKEYGITCSSVYKLIKGRSWKHLQTQATPS